MESIEDCLSSHRLLFDKNIINLRLFSLLLKKYYSVNSASMFFERFIYDYCQDHLGKESDAKMLYKLSELSFNLYINDTEIDYSGNLGEKIVFKRIATQSTQMNFYLCAYYVLNTIDRSVSRKLDTKSLNSIDHVYHHEICSYATQIVNETDGLKKTFFDIVEDYYDDFGINLKAFCAYLLGRIQGDNWKAAAKAMLGKIHGRIDFENSLEGPELVLNRSIYISLIKLSNNSKFSDQYIGMLLSNSDWDSINRGFHLEYYEDVYFDPKRDITSYDRMEPFKNTYEVLKYNVIEKNKDLNRGGF